MRAPHALRGLILVAVAVLMLSAAVPAQAAASKIEAPATEFNDAREPLAIGCDGEVYTAVAGYFVGTVVFHDDVFRLAVRTDHTRPVIVEDTAGHPFVMEGNIVSEGIDAPEGDIANWAIFNFRIFDAQDRGSGPVVVIHAYGEGAGGDTIVFTRVNGTCESINP